MEVNCITCGKVFKTTATRIADGRGKYCSFTCRSHQRKNPPIPCPTCREMFHPNNRHRQYCSRSCTPAPNTVSNPILRFWEQVDKESSPTGCWIWIGCKDKRGYGNFSVFKGEKWIGMRAHRYAAELASGEVPPESVAIHACDNPSCVRIHPNHVSFGSQQENIADKVRKGRQAKGETNGRAVLTEEDVRNIRKRLYSGEAGYKIAADYGIAPTNVTAIYHRRTWKHVI